MSAPSPLHAPGPLTRFDVLMPRVHGEVAVRTCRGGTLSVLAMLFTTALTLQSVARWAHPGAARIAERLVVDTQLDRKLPIHLDVVFPRLSCADVELVAMDVSGEAHLDMAASVTKVRLGDDGEPLGGETQGMASSVNRDKQALKDREVALRREMLDPDTSCGSCYGAETGPGDCCRTCHDVKSRYAARNWDAHQISREAVQCLREMSHPEIAVRPGEGCALSARLLVNKVAGNFHVALGQTRATDSLGLNFVHTFQMDKLGEFDTSHNITRLLFGDFLKLDSPLDGLSNPVDKSLGQTAAMQYFIHLVPEVHGEALQQQQQQQRIGGDEADARGLVSYRYTYTSEYVPVLDPEPDKELITGSKAAAATPNAKHMDRISTLPGVYFIYDFSPFMHVTDPVYFTLVDLLVDLVSIAGGLLAVLKFGDAALQFVGL